MRKNDEYYPLPIGVSDNKGYQNGFKNCVGSFVKCIRNAVSPAIASKTLWTKSSQINLVLIMKVELIYFQIVYQGNRRIRSMSFIKSLIQQLGLSKVSSITVTSHSNERNHDIYHDNNLIQSPSNAESCSDIFVINNLLSPKAGENEEELKLKLQAEIEDIMSQVGADGLTLDDKAILRSNLPIPEEYGIYEPIPDHLRKSIPVKYVPEENIFIIDEDRMEARKDWDV